MLCEWAGAKEKEKIRTKRQAKISSDMQAEDQQHNPAEEAEKLCEQTAGSQRRGQARNLDCQKSRMPGSQGVTTLRIHEQKFREPRYLQGSKTDAQCLGQL